MQHSPFSFPVDLHTGGLVVSKEKVGRLLCNDTCSDTKESKTREKFTQVQNIENKLEMQQVSKAIRWPIK